MLACQAWILPARAEAPLQLLPLERVRLYEVGVGYFERSGVLRNQRALGLSLPQSQLDDALASLVILGGKGQARIADIPETTRALLLRAGDQLYLAEIRRGALPKRKAELEEALGDVTRLEGHVRALGQTSTEGRLAAQRLRETEDRVRRLRQRISDLSDEIVEFEGHSQQILSALGDQKQLEPAPRSASPGG